MGNLATSRCNGIWETAQQTQWTFARTNLLQTCCGLVIYVADLLRGSRQLVTDLLRGNWCNGFWPLSSCRSSYIQSAVLCLMTLWSQESFL